MERMIRAPRGNSIVCKGWQQEAAMRMLMNNLDPEVAEDPQRLVVYGGSGKAARNWEAYDKIIETLKNLDNDETLLVQSGKPVAVFRTHENAPRVLISNSVLVPAWANWDKFREYERMGLTMYGQMTAGSWIYIGAQGILQGTYETFGALAQKHFTSDLKGKLVVTAGLGGMSGAQPLAVTMNGGVALIAEVDEAKIKRRLDGKFLDVMEIDYDAAVKRALEAKADGRAISIGLLGNAADILPRLLADGIMPDVVTDQTSAHDTLNGYVPAGISLTEACALRENDPEKYIKMAQASICRHVEAMLEFQKRGSIVFDYGNNIRQEAYNNGISDAFAFEGFVPAYIRPLFCEGKGPFRWVALSGDPEDIYKTDQAVMEAFPENDHLRRWLTMAREQVSFQGLPARICWLGYGERAKMGLIFNKMVRDGVLSAPIVIGRDHLDCGSVASPNRETENMKDGSDAIADWPVLNALVNTAAGGSWISFHHGGGVGIGYSLHAGMVIVADGSWEAEERLQRVLTTDPGMGIVRHADAGYEKAIEAAKKFSIKIPGITI